MKTKLLLFLFCCPAAAGALEPLITPAGKTVGETVKTSTQTAQNETPNSPDRVLPGEPPVRKNYVLPAIEIPLFLLTLNGYDRLRYGEGVYGTHYSTFKDHLLHGQWRYDEDPFAINQFGHPYQGALMFGFARSSGLNFWESLVYSNAGSALWKLGGERGDPSLNDQITTGQAGSILGEELYRMGSLVLERGAAGGGKPAAWRSWAAAAISPPTGLNRLLFGDRYKWMESRNPATFTRLRVTQNARASVSDNRPGPRVVLPAGALADFSMDYGLPGRDGYRYIRPLDYFNFEMRAAANNERNAIETVMTRGLLIGSKYEAGDDYRGVWGLYGSYDYIAPQVFRVSNTAASVGTTAQWWLSKKTALQGTAMGGAGFGAGGTTKATGERDYHYGVTPQGLLALKLILNDRVMLDATGRQYFITRLAATEAGAEEVTRLDGGAALRIYGSHALSVQYLYMRRAARYPGQPARHQSVGTIGVAYNLIGDPRFGAVDWDR